MQIKRLQEHKGSVTDLCFDANVEFLASSSSDGSLVVYGLYTQELQRFKYATSLSVSAYFWHIVTMCGACAVPPLDKHAGPTLCQHTHTPCMSSKL